MNREEKIKRVKNNWKELNARAAKLMSRTPDFAGTTPKERLNTFKPELTEIIFQSIGVALNSGITQEKLWETMFAGDDAPLKKIKLVDPDYYKELTEVFEAAIESEKLNKSV